MELQEVLDTKPFNQVKFKAFVDDKGLRRITVDDLNRVAKEFGMDVFQTTSFSIVFEYVTTDKTNRTMRRWTIAIGVMTAMMMIISVLGYYAQTNTSDHGGQGHRYKAHGNLADRFCGWRGSD